MLVRGTRARWGKGPGSLLVPACLSPARGLAPILCWGRATSKLTTYRVPQAVEWAPLRE